MHESKEAHAHAYVSTHIDRTDIGQDTDMAHSTPESTGMADFCTHVQLICVLDMYRLDMKHETYNISRESSLQDEKPADSETEKTFCLMCMNFFTIC